MKQQAEGARASPPDRSFNDDFIRDEELLDSPDKSREPLDLNKIEDNGTGAFLTAILGENSEKMNVSRSNGRASQGLGTS